ncbi:phosphatidylethanolamine N-methyltransferase [Zalerion maritima]|uniref:Phosphatidylethanolamine N-methyltransferase n=1 Tax=Zalerion maritima TaxID=339359 RepID=A0AAD5RU21_9PEZI|nr:phosphatidylethanolamine N-methyltransferase [Zalerion maritima]
MATAIDGPPADGGVRQRHPAPMTSQPETAMLQEEIDSEVEEDQGLREDEAQKPKKTFGRTPDGTVFTVPTTHDMVSQLLDPRQPKNLSDVIVLAILALHILAAWLLPSQLKRPAFGLIFAFWRACYNIGIGYLLNIQSNHKRLVRWAWKFHLFENPETGKNPRPWLYKLLKSELEAKIPEDYKFEEAPIEYNTWLVFRRVVDLILMCDFVSYCLFAIVCGHRPENESLPMGLARWIFGISLVAFNLWVKLDAHRVVKDFAWYWGDFFYLVDADLTFDGVFEMAPHPMYSIGYAGYYGISAMAASYPVLFISIAAHLTQFAFLVIVENPHIEKTYNPPPPRKRTTSQGEVDSVDGTASSSPQELPDAPVSTHHLLGLANFDLLRTVDYSVVLLMFYVAAGTFLTPTTPFFQFLAVAHALLWRLWYSVGLGVILNQQSEHKMWTRHFLKFGETRDEAWRQWKGMYHISMAMCYASFIAACWKMYTLPADWNYGWVLLKHVVGYSLVALQMWTALSIHESLGEFGWFFGDFFFDNKGKLTYGSIYRFLNNPERVLGTSALWGAALITWSRSIFILVLVSQLLTAGFLSYVEKPHMQKVYGRSIRREAGLTKFIKRALPPPIQEWQEKMDKTLDQTKQFVDDFVETARPKLAAGVSTIVRDTGNLFNKYPARLTITRLTPDVAGLDPKHYSLSFEPVSSSSKLPGPQSYAAHLPQGSKTQVIDYGAPIRVKWTAPAKHSERDWVGIYMVTDNRSRERTEISSQSRWVPTNYGAYDATREEGIIVSEQRVPKKDGCDSDLVTGEMIFTGDKLWWRHGVFEFRYHHDGHHNVMTISQPFEIRIAHFDEISRLPVDSIHEQAVEEALMPVVENCLDRDLDIAPATPEEPFGAVVERDSKYANRVVYVISHMFGIEFAPAVVPADGNVKKLAWRICNAKQVLAPYSMNKSGGTSTPTDENFPSELK